MGDVSPLSSEMEREEGERGRGAKLPFSATAKKAGHPIQRRGGGGSYATINSIPLQPLREGRERRTKK